MLESRMDVAEVYSPPRMARAAKRHGLKGGWSLDITVNDPLDNQPWDLGKADKQKRAMELVDQDKPMLLIASPMCTPFSSWQNINHAKMKPGDEAKNSKPAPGTNPKAPAQKN